MKKEALVYPEKSSKLTFLKKEFFGNLVFLKNLVIHNKKVFYVVLIVFVLGFIAGFILPDSIKLIIFNSIIDQFSKFDNSGNNAKTLQEIFLNNLRVSFTSLIFGITIIIPLFILFSAASLPIGIIYDFISRISQLNLLTNGSTNFVISLLPHGIIELGTAVFETFMAVLIGLKIFFSRRIEPNLNRKDFIFKIVKAYIFIIIPLIFIAALIESFVSGPITKSLFATEIQKDLTLSNFVINQEEINTLGISAAENNEERLNKEKDNFIFKQTIAFLYNKEIFEMLKKTKKPIHTISKSYLINEASKSLRDIEAEFPRSHKPPFAKATEGFPFASSSSNKAFSYSAKGNNKFNFGITISQFKSAEEAEEQTKLIKKAYELLEEKNQSVTLFGEKINLEKENLNPENQLKITSLGNNLYKINYSKKTSYLKSYKINNYLLTASFVGDNLELFYKLFDLQVKKTWEKIKIQN